MPLFLQNSGHSTALKGAQALSMRTVLEALSTEDKKDLISVITKNLLEFLACAGIRRNKYA